MAPRNEPRLLWRPLPSSGKSLKDFTQSINDQYGTNIRDYMSLWQWSVDPKTAPLFWLALFEFLRIKSDRTPQRTFYADVRVMGPPEQDKVKLVIDER